MQQRSTRTLYNYWNELRADRSAPERREIDPTRIRDALSNTFIIESNSGTDFNFRLAGSHLCSAYCRELKSRSFGSLFASKDQDALGTLFRAVTQDQAVALITFEGFTDRREKLKFETILLPLQHNGQTNARILGGMTALENPYWLGIHPIVEQRISGLRLIWADDHDTAPRSNFSAVVFDDIARAMPNHATLNTQSNLAHASQISPSANIGYAPRRYAHLAVIDGGKN